MSIDCEALEALVDRDVPEDLKLELKCADYLQEPDWKDSIAQELTALANRLGGLLVLGINDDGGFEGPQNFQEAQLRQDLDNICHDKISPRLDYDLQLLSCSDGDVAVIQVPQRTGMPHAIIRRSGAEIASRKYYVRTKHGKRLADDNQLAAMFETPEHDPGFEPKLHLVFDYSLESGSLLLPEPPNWPRYLDAFSGFLRAAKFSAGSHEEVSRYVMGLCTAVFPYAVLADLAQMTRSSWIFEWRETFSGRASSVAPTKADSTEIPLVDLPVVDPKGFIKKARLNISEILESQPTALLNVPAGTEVGITQSDSGVFPKVLLQHPAFRVRLRAATHEVGTRGLSRVLEGPPADSRRPIHVADLEKIPYAHNTMTVVLESSFDFVEQGVDARAEYRQFVRSLRDYLCREWDALDFIRRHRGVDPIMRIEAKLDQLRKDLGVRRD